MSNAQISLRRYALFDFATSAFSTIIITFVFGVYFTGTVLPGDAGQVTWSYALGFSGVLIALFAPAIGLYSDRRPDSLMPILRMLVFAGVAATSLLYLAEPNASFGALFIVVPALVLANACMELALLLYNRLLPMTLPEGDPTEHMARNSGLSWGAGYIGGLLALVGILFGVMKFMPAAEAARLSPLLVAAWVIIGALPLLTKRIVNNPPAPITRLPFILMQLVTTPRLLWFLVASMFYRDGLITLFAIGGVYAHAVYNMEMKEVILFAIGLNVTAGFGAFLFAQFGMKVPQLKLIRTCLVGLILFGVVVLLAPDKQTFLFAALALGVFIGPVQASSRTWLIENSPQTMLGLNQGLYALTGKATSFMGPLFYGLIVQLTGNLTMGLAVIPFFWFVGLILLNRVYDKRV